MEQISVILRGNTLLILYFDVNVKTLSESGKDYPWKKPQSCPRCNSRRLWWHSFVQRCFSKVSKKVYLKKCICVDCSAVHTLRPITHLSRFQYSLLVITRCLLKKIRYSRWRSSVTRQNQQYWFKVLRMKLYRYRNVDSISIEDVKNYFRYLREGILFFSVRDPEVLRL